MPSGRWKGERGGGQLVVWRSMRDTGGCHVYAAGGLLTTILVLFSVYATDGPPPSTTVLRLTGFHFISETEETVEEYMGGSHEMKRACGSRDQSKMFFGPGPSPCPNLFRAVRFGSRHGVRDGPFSISSAECWDTPRSSGKVWRRGGSATVVAPNYAVYTPEEACDIVSSFSGVFLIGDSLIRHLTQGLFVVLSGDKQRGALRWWENNDTLALCHGEEQFKEKQCRPLTLTSTTQFPTSPPSPEAPLSHYCPRHNFSLSYLGFVYRPGKQVRHAEGLVKHERHLRKVLSRWCPLNPVIIYSPSALHRGLDPDTTRSVIARLHKAIQNVTRGAVEILAPLHSQDGDKKDPDYSWQNLTRTVELVDNLRGFVEGGLNGLGTARGSPSGGIEVFDTINMTQNCESFDGVHFTLDVNVLKAQLLLNRLDQIRRERKLMPRCL